MNPNRRDTKRYSVVGSSEANNLIISHLKDVKIMAKEFKKHASIVELYDLIQAGSVGLVEAAKRFDKARAEKEGIKFLTYAYSWIKKYMTLEYIHTRYMLHVPDKELRKVSYANRRRNWLIQLLGREPSYDELVRELTAHLDSKEAVKVTKIIAINDRVYSLDRKISEDTDITFADVIPDPDRIEDTLEDVLPETMNETLATLTPQENRVLEIRFGIGTGKAFTLEETAKEFGISKERIRQIEAKALRKLRHPSRSRKLRDFLK
ncbi:MAG: sigma-70 family RNA polymerase sigma factor [Dehalococcoidales bacterium]|nr:sigma-70 family RNA polymerase sigma factor [Dehalococcoidales bacterium]